MTWKTVGLSLALSLAWTTPGLAQGPIQTGNDLLRVCLPALRYVEQGSTQGHAPAAIHCWGYLEGLIAGYHEGVAFWDALMGIAGASDLCIPPQVSSAQLVAVAVAALRASPQTLHTSAARLALTAIKTAFPCPTPPGLAPVPPATGVPSPAPPRPSTNR
jgi:hypothetical protein